MSYPIGQYFIDGIDLFLVYGVFAEDRQGSDALLQLPKRKEAISHDWGDENGIDTDLSRVFFESRDTTFNFVIAAANEADFWTKYNGFIGLMAQPGLRRMEITEFGRSFYLFYKECTDFKRKTRIKEVNKIAAKFSVTFTEQNPQMDASNVYLVDEADHFLIT